MAALVSTTMQGPGQRTATPNTLTASDTFTYVYGKEAMLLLYNPTGGTIAPGLKSASGSSRTIEGGVSATFGSGLTTAISLAAGKMAIVNLDEMYLWLGPSCLITGGTGLIAFWLTK